MRLACALARDSLRGGAKPWFQTPPSFPLLELMTLLVYRSRCLCTGIWCLPMTIVTSQYYTYRHNHLILSYANQFGIASRPLSEHTFILDGGQENHMTTEHALNLPVRNLSLCFSTESSHKLVLYPVSLVSYYFFHHCDDNHPFNVLTTQEDKHRPFKVLPLEFLYRLISDN